MSMMLSITLLCRLTLAVQVISAIPDAPLRFKPVYLSSQQEARLKLSGPAAIAVARSGNIYIFDDGNSRVVRLDPRVKFIGEFGQPVSVPGAIDRAGLNDSIAVDENENVYVSNLGTPRVLIFSSNGTFQRSFRVPFPMTSIAVNKKREIFLTADTAHSTELIYVFSETGKFLRRFGEKLITLPGSLARNINVAVAACDVYDNLFVAFRSWPLIRKYSPEGKLIGENQFTVPAGLIKEGQREYYSLGFFNKYPDSSFIPPIITHSISISGAGTGYLLLNGHSIVVFAPSGKVTKEFHFRAPRDRDNAFVRLAAVPIGKAPIYLLDTRSGEIYATTAL